MDEIDLQIVESLRCVRCGAQCEEQRVGDLLVYTCPEDQTRHVLTVAAPTEAAVPEGEDPLVGTVLGPCRIEGRAGTEGGLPLYHGVHTGLEHPAVVRVLAGEAAQDASTRERFVAAARFAAAVRHGAIANVVHLSKFAGGMFAVSEALEGAPIELVGRLAPLEAIRVARPLAEALAGLHDKGIVHRNIGPKTVYRTPMGAPLLCNFAWAVGPKQPPDPSEVVGQPGYLAPEQATGGEVDGRADLYALGALLYHLLAGRGPFIGSDPSDVVRNQVAGKTPDRGPLAGAPPALAELVLALLVADPEERPVDAQVVLGELATAEAQALAPASAAAALAGAPQAEAEEAPGLGGLALEEDQLGIAEPLPEPAAAIQEEPIGAPEELTVDFALAGDEPEEAPPPPTIPRPPADEEPAARPEPAPDEPPRPAVGDAEVDEQPSEAELVGPELPEPDAAPASKAAEADEGSVLGELVVLAADADGDGQDSDVLPRPPEEEAKPSIWETQRRAIILLGVLVVLAGGWGLWKLVLSPAPAADRPPAPADGGKPKPPPKPSQPPKPKELSPEEKLEKEAAKELAALTETAQRSQARPEEIVKSCDAFLEKYAKTDAAGEAYEIRQKAQLALREREAERELRELRVIAGDREKTHAERVAAMDALIAKYSDIETEKVVEALKAAKTERDSYVKRAEEGALSACKSARPGIEQALEKKDYGAALAALDRLVADHKGTKAGDEAAAQLTALRQRVATEFAERKTKAEALAARSSFDEAAALFTEPVEVWNVEAVKTESEALVATLRARRAAVVAGYGAFLAKWGELAGACKFTEALAAAQQAAAATEEPALKTLLAGKAQEAQMLTAVLERVVAGAKARAAALKPGEKIWVELGRAKFKGTIADPDKAGVAIDVPGRKERVGWGELSRAQLVSFAAAAKPEPKAADRVAFGLLALTGGEMAAAYEQFAIALEADPGAKDAIAAILQRGGAGLVHVPGGEFLAGQNRQAAEVRDFLIGAREVTNIEYAFYCKATGAPPPSHWRKGEYLRGHDAYPVTNVSWAEADAYAKWLAMRLPSDIEWEKAARGTDGRLYPWGNTYRRGLATVTPSEIANDPKRKARYRPRLVAVTRCRVQDYPFPLYHIVGNAREWTSTPTQGRETEYVVVGGSAADTEKEATAYARGKQAAAARDPFTGFRLAWPR